MLMSVFIINTVSIRRSVARATRDNKHIALIFIDLDGFKGINDTLGHNAGDELLRVVSKRLMGVARQGDVVARLGGDEFVILLEGVVNDEKLSGFADQLKTLIAKALVLKRQELHLTASFGIATFPRDGKTSDELLQCADAAMYRAKQAGRDGYCFYSQELHQLAKDRVLMKHDLHSAIANREFDLHYQPIINANNWRCEKAEALIRWQHPVKGNVPPMDFIPVAEELGLISLIGQWVLWETCRQLAEWKEQSTSNHTPVISVNLSGRQLQQSELPSYIYETVQGFGLSCSDLEFEVTETHLMSDLKQSIEVLDAIIEMGCGIAIDDFGTGYSSFRHLQRLPKQTLKIDRSFVSGMEEDGEDSALVNAMIDMAKILKLKTVAEGVETEAQRDKLCLMGCDYLQGYFFSKPLPKDQFFNYFMRRDIPPDLFPRKKKNETGQGDSFRI